MPFMRHPDVTAWPGACGRVELCLGSSEKERERWAFLGIQSIITPQCVGMVKLRLSNLIPAFEDKASLTPIV